MIAHRGASAAFPENTLAAFRGAVSLGADAAEFDVRRTADGRPVIHHDPVVPGLGPICSFSAAELRRRAPWVPTLTEALEACSGLWVDVEVKNSPAEPDWDPQDAVAAEVARHLDTPARREKSVVSSFNQGTLARVRALAPALHTGLLADRVLSVPAAIELARDGGHRLLLPHAAALAGRAALPAIKAAHRAGLLVVAWTVDDPADVRRLADAGIDGVITNRPNAALSALGQDHHRHGG